MRARPAKPGRCAYNPRVRGLVFVLLTGCSFRAETGADADSVVDGSDAPEVLLPLCPAGYGPINGIGMYRSVEGSQADERTWLEAAADCNDDDGAPGSYAFYTHLVVLRDEPERIAITSPGSPVSGNTWIGLSDLRLEGAFEWVTAEPTLGYPVVGVKPPWDIDDPDDGGATGEDCVRFKNTSYALEDKPCETTETYVCECDAFPPI
jgi:hypothetical protein